MKQPEALDHWNGRSAGLTFVEGLEEVPWLAVQAAADALWSPGCGFDWWDDMTDMHELPQRNALVYRYDVYSQVEYKLP